MVVGLYQWKYGLQVFKSKFGCIMVVEIEDDLFCLGLDKLSFYELCYGFYDLVVLCCVNCVLCQLNLEIRELIFLLVGGVSGGGGGVSLFFIFFLIGVMGGVVDLDIKVGS